MNSANIPAIRYDFRRITIHTREATNHWERVFRWEESKRRKRAEKLEDDGHSKSAAGVVKKAGSVNTYSKAAVGGVATGRVRKTTARRKVSTLSLRRSKQQRDRRNPEHSQDKSTQCSKTTTQPKDARDESSSLKFNVVQEIEGQGVVPIADLPEMLPVCPSSQEGPSVPIPDTGVGETQNSLDDSKDIPPQSGPATFDHFSLRRSYVVLDRIDETNKGAYGIAIQRLENLRSQMKTSTVHCDKSNDQQTLPAPPSIFEPNLPEDNSPEIIGLDYRQSKLAASSSTNITQVESDVVDLSLDDNNCLDTVKDDRKHDSDATKPHADFQDDHERSNPGQDAHQRNPFEHAPKDDCKDEILGAEPISPSSVTSHDWFFSPRQPGGLEDYARPPEIADYTSDEN